jgi:hypothetical protein
MPTDVPADTPVECPSWATLADYSLGKLPAAAIEAVAGHISTCPHCETALHELQPAAAADSVVGRVQECLRRPPPPDETARVAMEAAARALADRAADGRGPARAAEPPPVRSVGPYDVLGTIGRGGMGVVYRARQVPVNRLVALKMVLAGAHAYPEVLVRFRTEGEAVARLQHPNVVQIYEFGEQDGLPYYSMELVEGETLAARLAGGPLGARAAAELVRTLAEAVAFAHAHDVIHRDLKPANILLAPGGVPKITDFGLAKLLDAGGGGLTETNAVLGTPRYMAPEQAGGGSGATGPATDVYALGVILYECLVGRPPFEGDSNTATRYQVRTAEPVPPSRLRPGVPRDLEAVCLKCLAKSPAQRYPSARALADDLGRWLRDERPRGIPGRLGRAVRAVRRRGGAVAAGLALLLVGAAVYLHDPDRPLHQMQAELARGGAVTLIDAAGRPRWSRWRTGAAKSQTSLATDGAFRIHTWGLCLFELLPDPQCDRYRFAARVRHEQSDRPGEVGLYAARQTLAGGGEDTHFFTQLTFNDVKGAEDLPFVLGPGGREVGRPRNMAHVFPHLYSEEGVPPGIEFRMRGAPGPHFQPAGGEGKGAWHDLALTVTPAGVTAEWDGQPFALDAAAIRQSAEQGVALVQKLHPGNSFIQQLRPAFPVRGGFGLYLWRGSASFRSATITPLPADQSPAPRGAKEVR